METTKTKNNLLIVAAAVVMTAITITGAAALGFIGGALGFTIFWVALILLRGSEQKVVDNSLLPFPGFSCINICGYLLARSELSEKTINHEAIHTAQMKEMWYIGFYLWYFGEWFYQCIVRIFNKDMKAYYYITMEQEAYKNEGNTEYLSTRKRYAWWEFIGEWKKY